MSIDLLWAFATGLAGSLHCLGMCGPLVIVYSMHLTSGKGGAPVSHNSFFSTLGHHTAFQIGRIAAYSLMGGAAAGIVHFSTLSSAMQGIRIPVSIAGGCIMIFCGLVILKIIPAGAFIRLFSGGSTSVISHATGRLLSSQQILLKAALGVSVGFLPCMLSWAMVLKAGLTANIAAGVSTMILFGLGTAPALLLTGLSASLISVKTRLIGERVAGFSVIVMGVMILWKGVARLA